MYKTYEQLFDEKYFIESGENLIDSAVHNRVHAQLAENVQTMYYGIINVESLLGITPTEELEDGDIPNYLSSNYIYSGMDIKRAIETLDSQIYSIYTMTITKGTVTSGEYVDPGDEENDPVDEEDDNGGGGGVQTIDDYIVQVTDAKIHEWANKKDQVDTFALAAYYYKDSTAGAPVPIVGFGFAHRPDITSITTYQHPLREIYYTGARWDRILTDGVDKGYLDDNVTNARYLYGYIAEAYKDKFGKMRLIGEASPRNGALPGEVDRKVRYRIWGKRGGVDTYMDCNVGGWMNPTGSNNELVVTSYLTENTDMFFTLVNMDTGDTEVHVGHYDDDTRANNDDSRATKPFTKVNTQTMALADEHEANVTSFIFKNPNLNIVDPTAVGNIIWVYKNGSSNYVYRSASLDGTTWSAEETNFSADTGFFDLPDNIVGSPTAIELPNGRIMIACIAYRAEDDTTFTPVIYTYLSSADGTIWREGTKLPSFLYDETSLPSRRRKIALTSDGTNVYGYVVSEGRETTVNGVKSVSICKLYKLTFSLALRTFIVGT